MKKIICLIIMIVTCRICEGQNLVPNGNFEQFSSCPFDYGKIDSALNWINPSVGGGTPDYFNQCGFSGVGVPYNWGGYQQAHSGVAYAGITVREIPDFREYIEVPLNTPLTANLSYHFEMYVNLADACNKATDDIGVYFSISSITGINNYLPLPYLPQITNTNGFLADTVNWTLVSGSYTATGGESFLIIGNFKDDINSTFLIVKPNGQDITYFYIDDVSLTLTTGMDEEDKKNVISIFPNPCTDKLNITTKTNELLEVSLYDVTSRKVFHQSFTNSTSINTEQLAKAIYLYEVRNKSGVIKQGKVVKD